MFFSIFVVFFIFFFFFFFFFSFFFFFLTRVLKNLIFFGLNCCTISCNISSKKAFISFLCLCQHVVLSFTTGLSCHCLCEAPCHHNLFPDEDHFSTLHCVGVMCIQQHQSLHTIQRTHGELPIISRQQTKVPHKISQQVLQNHLVRQSVCAVPRLARMDTFASGVSNPMSVARAQTARVPCTLWSNAVSSSQKKKTQRQGRLVVHMPSATYHELSRAQPKLGGKCVSVGVDGVGCCVERKKRDLTSTTVTTKNEICNRT